jgi:hypothetical protein
LTINPTMTTRPPAARSLHEILVAAAMARCGECWKEPGVPCAHSPAGEEGYHVARLGRAMRRGLISGRDLVAVLQALVAFDNATLVFDVPAAVL